MGLAVSSHHRSYLRWGVAMPKPQSRGLSRCFLPLRQSCLRLTREHSRRLLLTSSLSQPSQHHQTLCCICTKKRFTTRSGSVCWVFDLPAGSSSFIGDSGTGIFASRGCAFEPPSRNNESARKRPKLGVGKRSHASIRSRTRYEAGEAATSMG